jgi:hypothetical protein
MIPEIPPLKIRRLRNHKTTPKPRTIEFNELELILMKYGVHHKLYECEKEIENWIEHSRTIIRGKIK